jgi:hypothetical protein
MTNLDEKLLKLAKEAENLGINLVHFPPEREIDLDFRSAFSTIEEIERYAHDYNIPVSSINIETECFDESAKHWLSAEIESVNLANHPTPECLNLIEKQLIPRKKEEDRRKAEKEKEEKALLKNLLTKYGNPNVA